MFSRLLDNGKGILESINGITQTRESIAEFGDVVHDYSEIHRDLEVAKKFGFRDTPIIGVHSAAIGGRVARNILSVTKSPDSELYFTGQNVKLSSPIYPGEQINWELVQGKSTNESISYRLIVPNGDKSVKPKIDMECQFTTAQPEYQERSIEYFSI